MATEIVHIRIGPGQEVMAVLADEIAQHALTEGAIVSVIGAVDEFCISTMPADDARKDVLTEYHIPCELSGTGEIRDGKPHIHAVLGRSGDQAISGHLHWAKVKSWYVSVFILISKKV